MDVFSELRSRGAAKALVYFSGGNDEGFCDAIRLVDQDGNTVLELEEYDGGDETWDPVKRDWVPVKPDADRKLAEMLCQPVYDRYGSFAGDFYVSGVVTWDVSTRKATFSGQEGRRTYEDIG